MDRLLNLISAPIPIIHNAVLTDHKDLLNDYVAYVTTYSVICREKQISSDSGKALKAALLALSKGLPEQAKLLKNIMKEVETVKGSTTGSAQPMREPLHLGEVRTPTTPYAMGSDDFTIEFVVDDEEEPNMIDMILGSNDKEAMAAEEFYKNIGNKLEDICKYVEHQMQIYKIPGVFIYNYSHDDTGFRFRVALNEAYHYEGVLDNLPDCTILLSMLLDIIDYIDYEAVNIHSSSKLSSPSTTGFDNRIKLKLEIKECLGRVAEQIKSDDEATIIIDSLDACIKLFDNLISPDNKDTCLKKVINFVASVGKNKKIESMLLPGSDPIQRSMKYISIYG